MPIISAHAGTKHIRTAGLPACFRSEIFSDRPALVRIIISAIWRKSAEIFKIEESIRFSAWGLNTIPVRIIPKSPGSLAFVNRLPKRSPSNKINAILVNMKNSSFYIWLMFVL